MDGVVLYTHEVLHLLNFPEERAVIVRPMSGISKGLLTDCIKTEDILSGRPIMVKSWSMLEPNIVFGPDDHSIHYQFFRGTFFVQEAWRRSTPDLPDGIEYFADGVLRWFDDSLECPAVSTSVGSVRRDGYWKTAGSMPFSLSRFQQGVYVGEAFWTSLGNLVGMLGSSVFLDKENIPFNYSEDNFLSWYEANFESQYQKENTPVWVTSAKAKKPKVFTYD